jgi:outer membrane protein assembly factor BamB
MRARALAPLLGTGLFVAAALLAPVLATERPWISDGEGRAVVRAPIPFSPVAIDLAQRLRPPDRTHWLGTDDLGRDVLARLVHGARVSVFSGLLAAALALAAGAFLGTAAALGGGVTDRTVLFGIEVVQAFPALVLVAAAAEAAGLYAWWRMPGVLELDVRPAGARIEIAGRVLTAADKPVPLSLHPGGYEVRVSLDDHDPETREVLVARNQTKPFAIVLRHHQGRLDADGEPLGSEIQVDGVSYGSRIRNLALETGPHRLLAWAFDCFDRARTIRLTRGQQARKRLWLDRGRMWTHRAPSIQGGACLVADVDGDGIPDFAQNDIQEIAIHSSATGEVLARIPAPASGSRTFTTLELGGPVGTVIATAKEYGIASGVPSPLEVFLVRTAAPTRLLWRRSIVTGPWKTPSGASILAVGDWNGDGVAELAVSSRNGRATILNGTTGETIRDAAVTEGETEYPPGLTTLGAREPGCVCFAGSPPGAPSAEGRATVVGCVNLRDGAALWRKDLGIVRGTLARDLDGDGVTEILVWTETGWFALDGRTGQARWTNALPGGKRMPPYPWLADLDGDGRLEFVWASGSEPDTLLALRLDDGRAAWEGPAGARFDSIQLPDGLLPRAPRGEILLPVGPGLAAVDPRSGRVAWSAPGVPMGLLVADVDQDSTAEILETIPGVGLVCLDAEGRTRWTLRLNLDVRPYMLMPDVDGDGSREILIHRHAALYGLVRATRTLGQQQAGAPLQATPLVVNAGPGGRPVIIQSGSWDNGETLRGFDPDSGAVRWGTKCLFQANRALAVADWDGDGRPDVAAIGQWPRPGGRSEQALVVLRADDGHVVRSIPMPDAGSIYSIPVVADLNGDGVNDFATHRWDRQDVVAVDGKTGDVMWTHPTKSPNMGGVAAADLDGDGLPDVVAPSMDGHVYALRGKDGTPLWAPVRTGPGSRSPPLLHDVTGDGVPDVLVVSQDGVLHVIDGRRGTVAWTAAAEGASEGLGHPVVARSGGGPVLVLAPLGGAGVVAFDAATHTVAWQAPADRVVLASPVVADLDHDGALEVVATTADGAVFVLDLATGRELWRVQAGSQPIEADPAVVDLDGDGVLDILIACHDFTLTAISGRATGSARKRLAAQKHAPR